MSHSSHAPTFPDLAPSGTPTVAERLGIANPAKIEALFYSVGSEPVTLEKRQRAPRAAEVRASKLDGFKADAAAGVPDRLIAKQAKASVSQVKKWRLQQGLRHVSGRPTAEARLHSHALELFGRPEKPTFIPAQRSPVLGKWEPPLWVLRMPLNYELLVRIVDHASSMFSADDIAAGLGLRKVDVVIAQRLGARLRNA